MYFLLFFLLLTLSLSMNRDLQNSKPNLNCSSTNIFHNEGNNSTLKNESLPKSSDLLSHKNSTVADFKRNIEGNFRAYFGYWDEKLDGVWKFTPYDLNADHLSNSIMSHDKGRISLKFKWVDDTNFGNIIHIDIDLYDGDYKNKMLKFYLDFEQDFKIYTKDIIRMDKNEENIHFSMYNFIHKSYYLNYTLNTSIEKIVSTDERSMRIESNQAGFNGLIEINLNLIYLGWINTFCITDYILWNLTVTMIWLLWVNSKIFNMQNDEISHMWLSPITIAISIIWNMLLMLEYFYLAFTWEEYFLLYILAILQFLTTAYLYYFLEFIYSRLKKWNLSVLNIRFLYVLFYLCFLFRCLHTICYLIASFWHWFEDLYGFHKLF